NAPAFFCDVHHRAPLADIVAQGFLTINIQPMIKSGEQLQRVPVGWCGDYYRLKAGSLKQVFVQLKCLRSLALKFLDFLGTVVEMLAVNVTKPYDFNPTGFKSRLHVHHSIPPTANESHLELAVGVRAPDQRRKLA